MVSELVGLARQGDTGAMYDLIEQFCPLLKRYSRAMGSEDAYNDLVVDFISTIKSKGLGLLKCQDEFVYIAYISKSIRRAFIRHKKISERSREAIPISSLSEEMLLKIEYQSSTRDDHSSLTVEGFKELLTEREYSILVMRYIDDAPVATIAARYGISRQAVNQAKLAAIRKIEESLKC